MSKAEIIQLETEEELARALWVSVKKRLDNAKKQSGKPEKVNIPIRHIERQMRKAR